MVKLYPEPNGEIFSFGMEVSLKLKFLEKKENHVTKGNGSSYLSKQYRAYDDMQHIIFSNDIFSVMNRLKSNKTVDPK